jgi:hypothetical protein
VIFDADSKVQARSCGSSIAVSIFRLSMAPCRDRRQKALLSAV